MKHAKQGTLTRQISVLLILSLTLAFPIRAVAIPYSGFTNNLAAGRYTIGEEVTVVGETGSPLGLVATILAGITIGVGTYYTVRGLNYLEDYFFGDPQDAYLFRSFEIAGTSIFDELIAESTLPENVLLETYLPEFLGGSTFTATSAFSGNVFDSAGNIIPNTSVGFGVFETVSGVSLFSPITFVEDPNDFELIKDVDWDLRPVELGLSGSFEAKGLTLQASETPPLISSVPEPSTLLLLLSGLSLIMASSWKRLRQKNYTDKGCRLAAFIADV